MSAHRTLYWRHHDLVSRTEYLCHMITATKDWATRTLLNTGRELVYFGRLSSTCTSSGTRRVTLATNHVMSIERTRFCDYDKLNDCSEFGSFVIILNYPLWYFQMFEVKQYINSDTCYWSHQNEKDKTPQDWIHCLVFDIRWDPSLTNVVHFSLTFFTLM
jgi:hypothetical protein